MRVRERFQQVLSMGPRKSASAECIRWRLIRWLIDVQGLAESPNGESFDECEVSAEIDRATSAMLSGADWEPGCAVPEPIRIEPVIVEDTPLDDDLATEEPPPEAPAQPEQPVKRKRGRPRKVRS